MDIDPKPAPTDATTPEVQSTPNISTASESTSPVVEDNLVATETTPTDSEKPDDSTQPTAPTGTSTFNSSSINSTFTEDPGFKLGIISLIFSLVALGLLGVIFGLLAFKKSKNAGFNNYFAIAGIIIGSIEVIIGSLILILLATTLPTILSNS